MQFDIIDASLINSSNVINFDRGGMQFWPFYQTEDLMMGRILLKKSTVWGIAASTFCYFIYVIDGGVIIRLNEYEDLVMAEAGFEIPENVPFSITTADNQASTNLIITAGRELLPGTFFNTLNNAFK